MEIGPVKGNPLQDRYGVASSMVRCVCTSADPLGDIMYWTDMLEKLWEQNKTRIENEIKNHVLKVKSGC